MTTPVPRDDTAQGDDGAAGGVAWLEGYEWALSHLTDPGVLADARRLALAHESAEAAHGAFSVVVPQGGDFQGARTPPAVPSPLHSPGCASVTDGDYGPCTCGAIPNAGTIS